MEYALHACMELFRLDSMTVYRRLPIIMIEDVCLHSGFSVLVWHMMANIAPSLYMIEWTLGLVKFLCTCSETWSYTRCDTIPMTIPKDVLVWCILYRIEYGGMSGDLGMMRYLVTEICNGGIACGGNVCKEAVLRSTIRSVALLEVVVPAVPLYDAIDFHMMPGVVNMIGDVAPATVKHLMWEYSSSTNYRKLKGCNDEEMQKWHKLLSCGIRNAQMKYYANLLNKYDRVQHVI